MKKAFVLILFLCVCGVLFAADLALNGKKIVFYLDSGSGHFYVENPSPSETELKNLLFKDNPPTSYITLILEGKPYRLNDGLLTVKEPFTQKGSKISGVYALKNVEYNITFILTNSEAKEENDSVICLITVKNTGNTQINVGARMLFDTFYNERWGKPEIFLASGEKINYERLLYEASIPDYIFSGIYDPDKLEGLYIYSYLNLLHPSRIIIGNWKKLDENELDYTVEPQGKFKYNDFANKDAAVAVFFDKIYVKAGETINFGCILTRKVFTYDVFNSDVTGIQSVVGSATNTNTNMSVVIAPTNTNTVKPVAVVTNPSPTNTIVQKPATNVKPAAVKTDMIASGEVDGKTPPPPATGGSADLELIKAQLALMEKLTALVEKMDKQMTGPVETQKPAVITNTIQPAADPKKIEETKQAYEAELKKQKEGYEKMLAAQQKNIQDMIDTYEKRLNEESSLKNKNYSLNELDKALNELDNQISLVEELSKLNLDFKTMPKEQLDALKKQVETMESKLLKLKVK
ncbi:MAG: hypothetical protein HPY53_08610 [Brevinematales bacterium]|nr:hypothetical protein [Brevinematales bacterium]